MIRFDMYMYYKNVLYVIISSFCLAKILLFFWPRVEKKEKAATAAALFIFCFKFYGYAVNIFKQ